MNPRKAHTPPQAIPPDTTEFVIMGLLLDVAHDFHISITLAAWSITAYACGAIITNSVVPIPNEPTESAYTAAGNPAGRETAIVIL
jgi:hypothetical protein